MMRANPYTPGAGFMPAYLAGREENIKNAERYMISLKQRYPQQSVVYHGLRGVGKTVLLNRLEEIAEDEDILYEHIEIKEKDGFIPQIINSSIKFIRQMSRKEKAKEAIEKAFMAIKNLKITISPEEGSFSVGFAELEQELQCVSTLMDELTDVFVSLGNIALKTNDTICFFIDEIQYLKKDELEALVNGIHRVNQKRLPIMIFGAGLPKVLKELGEAKSYSERLFKFEEIGALSKEDARLAIIEPAKKLEVEYEQKAVEEIVMITKGYPYFIQEFCKIIWEAEEDNYIALEAVKDKKSAFYTTLDQGFFKVRYDRSSKREKDFMFAMVKCQELPCTISNVAKVMKKTTTSISPIRAQLISKGLIYATGHAEIDFTVPRFDEFLKRVNPELSLD